MGTNSALDRVMGAAETAAAGFTPPAIDHGAGAVAVQTPGGAGALAKPNLASFAESGGMTVDEYLRMDQAGFQIGTDMKKYFEEMLVELDMNEVIPIYSARGEAGGNTKFIKSYDGVVTPNGQNFQQALAHLEATTKCSGVYQSAEIPVTLLEDVKSADGVTIPADTRVGITPSVTGFKEFQSFVRTLTKQGLQDAVVKVKVKHLMRSNRNNNKWGVAQFELIEKIRD